MKVEGLIFAYITVFFFLVGGVYWWLSAEPMGSTALIFTGFMAALIGFYVLFTGSRVDPRPEDDPEGEIADIAGEYGFYSPHSWWPLPLGISAAIAAMGFIFGWWMIVLGAFFIILSSIGLVFEHYRGDFAH
jgi:Cytochrome c oxidase subunit IV